MHPLRIAFEMLSDFGESVTELASACADECRTNAERKLISRIQRSMAKSLGKSLGKFLGKSLGKLLGKSLPKSLGEPHAAE